MTNAPSQVVVVGSITADVTAYSRPLPVPGETVLGDTFTLVLGGKGANQALAAARAGATSTIIGCVGDDLFRDLVLSGLHDGGVGTAGITTVPGRPVWPTSGWTPPAARTTSSSSPWRTRP